MSLGATVKLLPYDIEVISSNLETVCLQGKVVYIYPPQTPLGGSLALESSFIQRRVRLASTSDFILPNPCYHPPYKHTMVPYSGPPFKIAYGG